MKYIELKGQIQKEVSAFPMKFAFSEKQLEEGLKELGVKREEVVSIGAGGFMRKTDREAFHVLFKKSNERMETALKDKAFMIDALIYELGNHEYCITYDPTDTLEALGLDIEGENVRECLKEARQIYLKSSEECN